VTTSPFKTTVKVNHTLMVMAVYMQKTMMQNRIHEMAIVLWNCSDWFTS